LKPHGKTWLRWLVAAVKLSIFLLLCGFIYHTLASTNQSLNDHNWEVSPWWLAVSGIFYLVGSLPSAVFWHHVLLQADQRVSLGETLRAYYISQLGKYVPGKWMVIYLRRVALFSPAENTVVAASVFFETLTSLTVGAAFSAVVLTIWYPQHLLLIGAAVGSTVLLGIPTIPKVFQWLIQVLGVAKLNPTTGAKLSRVTLRSFVIAWVTIAMGWALQGMGLWATLRAMGAVHAGPFENLALHSTAISLGVVAGFISQLPGGLGMREWVSAELVEPQYGAAVAMSSAVLLRFVLLVSELVISIILYPMGWRRKRPAPPVIQPEVAASEPV